MSVCVGLAMLSSGPAFGQTAPQAELSSTQAGYQYLKVGKVEVIAISDGTGRLPLTEGFVRNARPGELQRLLAEHAQPTDVRASVNVYVVKLGDRVILIDGGAGGVLGPGAGKAPLSLAAAGIRAEDITDIFITHMHPDHIAGLIDGDRRRYPNAVVHVARAELNYWSSAPAQAAAEGYPKTIFPVVASLLKPYADANRIRPFDGPSDFFPGFRAVPASGHTPGHSIYVLSDGGEELRFVGDILNVAIQFDDAALSLIFDGDMAEAETARRTALEEAASRDQAIALTHISFPGVGHVRRSESGYRWIPADYVNDAIAR
jgi:glyoxylase-like metal-dependent hydrolase (beta-lactamase superfamily II)